MLTSDAILPLMAAPSCWNKLSDIFLFFLGYNLRLSLLVTTHTPIFSSLYQSVAGALHPVD